MAEAASHTAIVQGWIERLRAGDLAAREGLIEHAADRLYWQVRRMLRRFPALHRWEQTDDVFNEATMRLYRSLEAVVPESPRHFYNLAAREIRRVLIDWTRHYCGKEGLAAKYESNVIDSEQRSPSGREPLDPSGEPRTLMEWGEFHELVESLPDPQRELFGLLWYAGLRQAEAAEVLGISERTLRRRWESARYLLYRGREGEPLPK